MAGRVRGLCRLARLAGQAARTDQPSAVSDVASVSPLVAQVGPAAALSTHWRSIQTSASKMATGTTDLTAEYEHVTGLEKQELEAISKGVDPWHEDWLDAPFGTAEKPVEVPSMFEHRVVGVPDPDDDSLVWWGMIEEGKPPKQIVEGGEYFVLKRVEGEGGHH